MGAYASDQAACWGYCTRTLNNTEPCGSMEKSTAIYVDIGVYNQGVIESNNLLLLGIITSTQLLTLMNIFLFLTLVMKKYCLD